jgi:hypothetical protein
VARKRAGGALPLRIRVHHDITRRKAGVISSGLGVDEGHDLVEPGPVAVRGVDLERRRVQRDPAEGAVAAFGLGPWVASLWRRLVMLIAR